MSGELKMLPDTSRCVQTVQDMSRQFNMCPDSSKYGRSRKMITHFLGMSQKSYGFFVRKIFGCHPEDIRFLGLWLAHLKKIKMFLKKRYSDKGLGMQAAGMSAFW